MNIPTFLAALSGGDLPADAVREERCLKAPIGCGEPLVGEDGSARVFRDATVAAQYKAESEITGLCADCQDSIAGGEGDGDRLSPQREALIGFCLAALPNEVGFEKAERLADRFEAAVRAESAAELAAVRAERDEVVAEIARFGIYGSATSAAKALVTRASELVDENATLRAERDEVRRQALA